MHQQNKSLVDGYTLLELIIALAVFAILVSLAIPSYMNYIQRGVAHTAGQTALKDAQFMEKYRALCGSYVRNTTSTATPPCAVGVFTATTNLAWPTLPFPLSPESGTSQYYISFSSAKPAVDGFNSYRLRAVPICDAPGVSSSCACVNSGDLSATTSSGGSDQCAVCVDQDGAVRYDQPWDCSNS